MANVKLSPPWCIFVDEVEELFRYDDEVHVIYDDDNKTLKLFVENSIKAEALSQLMPTEKDYGNVHLSIEVVPPNEGFESLSDNIWQNALEGNGAFSFVRVVSGIFPCDITYVVFKNRVVQYFNDDLSDYYGQCSTLYQTIAKNVFVEVSNTYFCTDIEEPVYLEKACNI